MGKAKVIIISIASFLAVLILSVFVVQGAGNKAIRLEEELETAKDNISIQEKKRNDLIPNLVDCVKNYQKHESETFTELTELRANRVSAENASTVFTALAESYPELKADKTYDNLMKELTSVENSISKYREAYNTTVKEYNRYINKFPTRTFLNMCGYEKQDFERIDYKDKYEDAPTDIFN